MKEKVQPMQIESSAALSSKRSHSSGAKTKTDRLFEGTGQAMEVGPGSMSFQEST